MIIILLKKQLIETDILKQEAKTAALNIKPGASVEADQFKI